jgi:hypothetical protein
MKTLIITILCSASIALVVTALVVKERFNHSDPRVAAESAAKEPAGKKAILAKTEEEYKTAERRAAHAYEKSEKGTLSGQIFVATKGGENVKLGAVPVLLFARDALNALRVKLSAFADAKSEQLQPDIAAAEKEEKQAEVAKQHWKAAEEQARAEVEQAKATVTRNQEMYRQGFATTGGVTSIIAAQTAVSYAESARITASEGVDRAGAAVNAARGKIESLSATNSYYHSLEFYFSHLRSPIQTAETDGDGKFTIQVPRKGDYVIVAQAQRVVWSETEKYYWIQPVSLEGERQRVLNLSNSNLISSSMFAAD